MNYDGYPDFQKPFKRIAIVGAGISGLGAAHLLSRTFNVTLFEAESRLGGHARTLLAGREQKVPVDTGFIVFNYENYPHLTALFDELAVPVKKSDMSFAASINDGQIEYGLQTLGALFADRKNALRPGFWQMIRDIFKFNARAMSLAQTTDVTLGEMLDILKMGDWFRKNFLLPITGAIWSTSPYDMLDFPAKTLVTFFANHGLLSVNGQHQWWTVDGGSREYVWRIESKIREHSGQIRLGAPVVSVDRKDEKVYLRTQGQEAEQFDTVVFACHSDQALKMLANPTPEERRILGALRYTQNKVYLHDDAAQMPKRKACWASWVYRAKHSQACSKIAVTYWMNRLQSIPMETPLFVTLNPIDNIRDECIFDEETFYHPQFDQAAIEAQQDLKVIQGHNATFYCGAYTRYGFHEDGLLSAVEASRALGEVPAWA